MQERFDIMQERVDKMISKLKALRTRFTTVESNGEPPTSMHLSSSSRSNHPSTGVPTQEARPRMIPNSFKLDVP